MGRWSTTLAFGDRTVNLHPRGSVTDGVANIGPRGVRRRRASGYIWLTFGLALAVAGIHRSASPESLALLVIPFGLAALGLLQAREKT